MSRSDGSPRPPLQFSLKFALGVVTTVSVICAGLRTIGGFHAVGPAVIAAAIASSLFCLPMTVLGLLFRPKDPVAMRENLQQMVCCFAVSFLVTSVLFTVVFAAVGSP